MKKIVTLNSHMALFALCGLLTLHTLPGFRNSLYSYAPDGAIAVLLLAFSDQILLTCLLIVVQGGQELNRFVGVITRYGLRAGGFRQAASAEKNPEMGAVLNPLLMAMLLIIAGTLSPSDGVDSGRYLSTFDLLARALLILGIGVGSFLMYQFLSWKKTGGAPMPPSWHEISGETDNQPAQALEAADAR